MKTVLTISDSIEGTIYDLLRCTSTIRDMGLDPLSVVPRISYKDGTSETNDVSEMLDYVFGECEFSSMGIGYITDPAVILYIADKLEQGKKCPVICSPSLISEDGEIMVSAEVYEALCDRLLGFADFLIVNTIEAEAFCGFECPVKNDFLRAAKKIFNVYGCKVLITGNERTDGQDVLFEGSKPMFIDAVSYEPGFEDKYSLLSALACEFTIEGHEELAASLAIDFVSGRSFSRDRVEAQEPEVDPEVSNEPKIETVEEAKAEPVQEEPKASYEPEVKAFDISSPTPVPRMTSSLVSPGKSIRDIARVITPSVVAEEVKPAVTSTIEKAPDPKGEVTNLASSRLIFDSKVKESITDLQSLKDRLNNLNKLADSGK